MHLSEQKEKAQPLSKTTNDWNEKCMCCTAGQVLVEMHVTDWAMAKKEDSELDAGPAMVGF